MKKVCVSAQVVAMALAGCSTASNDGVPGQLSALYSSYDCARLAAEQRRMYTRADDLASLGGATAREAEYARLRAEYEALREAATLKKCETPSTPSLQEARSDASAAQGGTGPRIAPPQTAPE
jgi:hypothetical protein